MDDDKCPQGHPKTPENRMRKGNGTRCRVCFNAMRRKGPLKEPLGHSSRDPEQHRAAKKAQRERSRARVLEVYGNACTCCGESIPMLLTIDHIDNDGGDHRRELGGGGYRLYAWLIKEGFPPGFQTLCWSCNVGKHLNGGTCPHQGEQGGTLRGVTPAVTPLNVVTSSDEI
ncbi:HNH endonuclease [Streptomyces phage Keanu]|nr:HNH endonuclease [Streptomyces phage Keanu]